MLKRLTRRLAHALVTTVFSVLEVLGWPKLDEARAAREREQERGR